MLELISLTVAFTLGTLLSWVIYTAVVIAVMSNPKAVKFITEWYLKRLEKINKIFDDVDIQ